METIPSRTQCAALVGSRKKFKEMPSKIARKMLIEDFILCAHFFPRLDLAQEWSCRSAGHAGLKAANSARIMLAGAAIRSPRACQGANPVSPRRGDPFFLTRGKIHGLGFDLAQFAAEKIFRAWLRWKPVGMSPGAFERLQIEAQACSGVLPGCVRNARARCGIEGVA